MKTKSRQNQRLDGLEERVAVLEKDRDEMGQALSFCMDILQRMAPTVADIVLKSQGSSLEEFAAKMEGQELANSSPEEVAPVDQKGEEPALSNETRPSDQ